MKKTLVLVLAVIMAITIFAGCSAQEAEEQTTEETTTEEATTEDTTTEDTAEASEDAATEETEVAPEDITGDLTLYTSEPEELVSEMVAKFNETYPNVNIEIFRSGTGKVTAKMDAELATGSTPANILWFADIAYINNLDQEGMIYHYTPQTAKDVGVDEQYLYNDGMGGEVRLIYNVIAYNTDEVTEAPKDWMDVTTEEYKGSFAMANPNYSGGAFSALVVHVQNEDKVGWAWYDALDANDVKFEESNGNLQTKVSSGEYKAVAIVDFMARTAKAEGSPVDYVYPESGAVLVPTPLSIMNNIPEESIPAAEAFVEWCYTEEAQELMVAQQYIPVNSNVAGPEDAPALEDIPVLPFDLDYFIENSSSIREEYTNKYGEAEIQS